MDFTFHVSNSKDILFYTNNKIKEWQNVPNSFINTILAEGKVLYG